MSVRLVDHCGICGSENLELVLSLGSSPPTCVMMPVGADTTTEERYPLDLLRCADCTLVQLSTIVSPEVVFPLDYPYSSGNSQALHDNFADLAAQAASWIGGLVQDDLIVDIGANDGTLLDKFHGCRKVGVEPTGQADRIVGPAYQEFFGEDVAHRISEEHGPAKIITACNVLAHVEDIDGVMRGIKSLLAEDGLLVAENHDLRSVVDGQWDTVYHEHLRFYSPYSFYRLLDAYELKPRTWDYIPTHGGSFRMLAKKTGEPCNPPPQIDYDFEGLAQDAANAKAKIRKAVSPDTWGIGATARATTIINYCELDMPCVCEVAGSDKIGHFIPGTSIPVVDEAKLFDEQPSKALLFSWHLADRIIPKLREKGYAGEIILPLSTHQYA